MSLSNRFVLTFSVMRFTKSHAVFLLVAVVRLRHFVLGGNSESELTTKKFDVTQCVTFLSKTKIMRKLYNVNVALVFS